MHWYKVQYPFPVPVSGLTKLTGLTNLTGLTGGEPPILAHPFVAGRRSPEFCGGLAGPMCCNGPELVFIRASADPVLDGMTLPMQ